MFDMSYRYLGIAEEVVDRTWEMSGGKGTNQVVWAVGPYAVSLSACLESLQAAGKSQHPAI